MRSNTITYTALMIDLPADTSLPLYFCLLWGKQTGSASYCGSMVLRVPSRGSDLKSRFFTFPLCTLLYLSYSSKHASVTPDPQLRFSVAQTTDQHWRLIDWPLCGAGACQLITLVCPVLGLFGGKSLVTPVTPRSSLHLDQPRNIATFKAEIDYAAYDWTEFILIRQCLQGACRPFPSGLLILTC